MTICAGSSPPSPDSSDPARAGEFGHLVTIEKLGNIENVAVDPAGEQRLHFSADQVGICAAQSDFGLDGVTHEVVVGDVDEDVSCCELHETFRTLNDIDGQVLVLQGRDQFI